MPTLLEELTGNAAYHNIPLADTLGKGGEVVASGAVTLTTNFQANNPNPSSIIGGIFGIAAVNSLLSQSGYTIAGFRYYFAIDPLGAGDITLVLVAIDENLNDIYTGQVLEMSIPCPTQCDAGNPLNGVGS